MLSRGPCFTPHGSGTFRRGEDILYTQSLVGDRRLLPPLGGHGECGHEQSWTSFGVNTCFKFTLGVELLGHKVVLCSVF